jgi:hypothetical protein
MKKVELEKLTDEQLKQKIKAGNSVLYVTLTLLIIYKVYMFYKMFEGTWEAGALIAIPFLLFASMMPILVNLKSLKEELKKRENS